MIEQIRQSWIEKMSEISKKSLWSQRLVAGEMRLCHYMGYLQETYHNTKWNPQLQAYCTMYLKNYPRDIFKLFYRHAISEISHDLMALDDLTNLGARREDVLKSNPLPQTVAFSGFPVFLMNFENPLSYLGYLFHLESLPTQNGRDYIDRLKAMGVPEQSLTFLEEHATVDFGHMKMMEQYVTTLVKTEEDLKVVQYAVCGAAELHSQMIQAAFDNGERVYGSFVQPPKEK